MERELMFQSIDIKPHCLNVTISLVNLCNYWLQVLCGWEMSVSKNEMEFRQTENKILGNNFQKCSKMFSQMPFHSLNNFESNLNFIKVTV